MQQTLIRSGVGTPAFARLEAPAGCALWRVDLMQPPSAEGLALLSDAEWARARRFAFRRDRDRFVAAHAALRQVLALHTGLPGAALELAEGPYGKPALVEQVGWQFNLSHSGDLALIALSRVAEIGVDVELPRAMPDAQVLAAAHFTPAEQAALAACPPAERARAFLVCWTRKEACVKAVGLGFQLDPRSFEVGIGLDPRDVLVKVGRHVALLRLCSFELRSLGLAGPGIASLALHDTAQTMATGNLRGFALEAAA